MSISRMKLTFWIRVIIKYKIVISNFVVNIKQDC